MMAGARWTEADIPNQAGRTAFVTGANSGIGFETARALAQAGAKVLLGCRDQDRAADAVDLIHSAVADADVTAVALDLADLSSVRSAAQTVNDAAGGLNMLINNAGVMALPRRVTADGFEMQFGTNHLGHFALTGLLIDKLTATEGSRVINVSSVAHRIGRIDFEDLDGVRRYQRWARYGQSKVANLLFTYELQRRLETGGAPTEALAAHPGGSATNLYRNAGPIMMFLQPLVKRFTQPALMGALPSLRAATDREARGGQYYGPDGFSEASGFPIVVHSNSYSHRSDVATQLWETSQQLTGVTYLDGAPGE